MTKRIAEVAAALCLSSCAALQFQQARDQVRIEEDLVYQAGSRHPGHRLDLYLPRHLERFPVVVFIHGGYWHSQDKNYFQAVTGLYGNVGLALAKQGIGAVVINYRLSPEVTIEGQLDDFAQAVRWTRERIGSYGGQVESLFLAGHSAGLASRRPLRLTRRRVYAGSAGPGRDIQAMVWDGWLGGWWLRRLAAVTRAAVTAYPRRSPTRSAPGGG